MAETWNIHDRLTLDLVREHTKTTDVPHVTNEQLLTYIDTAVEQAELYTGLVIAAPRHIEEQVTPPPPRYRANTVNVRTRYPSSDGVIYYRTSGGLSGSALAQPGARKITIPAYAAGIHGTNLAAWCCDPCSQSDGGNLGRPTLVLAYNAGYPTVMDIPAGIILGCLKFIAWSVEHPGDKLITMAHTNAERDSGILGTNNPTWASGALDLWRSYKVEGF